jgi:hypothetical protein
MGSASAIASRPDDSGLTLDRVWAVLAVGIPVIGALFLSMSTVDLAYHIRLGELILHGTIPRVDSFSFAAAGATWVDQQWLAQAAMALAHRAGGWDAVFLLKAGLVGLTFGWVFAACRSGGASPRAAAGLTLAGYLAGAQNLAMRPQLFAVTLFAAVLWISSTRRDHPARQWAIPVIALVWANLHGSFVLVPVLVGLDWLEDRRERSPGVSRTFLIGVLSVLATLVNPFGIRVWSYAVDIATNPTITRFASEWEPTSARTLSGIALFAWVAGLAWFFARRTEPVPWTTLLKLGVWFVVALPALRGVAWWGLAAPVAVAPLLAAPAPDAEGRKGSRVMNLALVGVLVAGMVVLLPWWRGTEPDGRPSILVEAPEGVVAAVTGASEAGDHVWVDQVWASWFEYRLPDRPVFVDSRIELYPEQTWATYLDVANGREGWQDVLDRYGVDVLALSPGQSQKLIERVDVDPGWRRIYRDEDGSVFVRASP